MRYQVPSDSPKPPEEQRPEVPSADQGELHDNRTLRRKIAPPPTSGAAQSTLRGTAPPSSLKPESTQSESKKAVSAEEFRPTVRRMAPPSTGHKTPLRASVTDPRRSLETSSASSKAGDAEPAQPVESTAASAIEDSTPGPAVVQPDALVDPNQFADKTMAIQMTAEMLDDLERQGPEVDFVKLFAEELPIFTLSEMLGIDDHTGLQIVDSEGRPPRGRRASRPRRLRRLRLHELLLAEG